MKTSKLRPLQLADVSKYKNEIYGICILWIVLLHGISTLKFDFSFGVKFLKPIQPMIYFGITGVEIFLFCSGIFLYYSFHKNPDILFFIKKRLVRLVLPVIVISGLYWIGRYIFVEHNIYLFISKLSMMDFWFSLDQQIWFISFILVCYFLYPYIHLFLFEKSSKNALFRLLILLAIAGLVTLSISANYPEIFSRLEIALTRFPVFFIGCFVGKFVYEKKTLPWYTYIICLVLSIISFYVISLNICGVILEKWIRMVAGISLTYVFVLVFNLLKFKPLNKFFAFFGKISINLYISHVIVYRLYMKVIANNERTMVQYVFVVLISIIIAYLAQLLIKLITKKSKNKRQIENT